MNKYHFTFQPSNMKLQIKKPSGQALDYDDCISPVRN